MTADGQPPSPDDHTGDAALREEIERLESELTLLRERYRRTAEANRSNAAELDRVRRELRTLKRRRSVRYGLAASDMAARVLHFGRRVGRSLVRRARRVRRGIASGLGQRDLRASPAAEAALATTIRTGLPVPVLDSGPLVSIVILNRNGRDHLERCLASIASTAYRDVEVVLVDNGSTDGSPDLAERFAMPFPIRIIRNDENRSFSDANGQGIAVAKGELICFLNNDVEAVSEGWLGYMVETMMARQAVAVGARLIYPSHRGGARAGASHPDLTLQHAGVEFDRHRAIPLARVIGAGRDPEAAWAVEVADRPALTAACLLVRRDDLDRVGGFSADYDYGTEDVDLCLKLRAAGGRLVYDGRATLWHHESATRAADMTSYNARVASNRATFMHVWGPRLFGDALRDAVQGGHRFSRTPFEVGVMEMGGESPAASENRAAVRALGTALEALGWKVTFLTFADDGQPVPDPPTEAVIVVDDRFDVRRLPKRLVTLAWIRGEPDAWLDRTWFDEFDIVLAPSSDAAQAVRERSAKVATLATDASAAAAVRDSMIAWASATRFGLRIGVTSWDVIDRWGDYHFARGLQRALERAGHPTRLHFLPDWTSPVAARDDVAVHLFGLKEAPTHPGQVNILWQISHPDLASPEIYERYDHVFVASDTFAAWMAGQVGVPVTSLHQATDPKRFRPEPGGPHHELLFVANSRRVHRRIVDDLAGTTRDLAIYGREWTPELADPRFVKGENVRNTELARYYSAADIVLNDHWDDMRFEGFISNRLYDALACRAFVISDHIDAITAEFDGAVPTYETRAELEQLIARYLDDPDERHRLADHGRDIVLERHTFDVRARSLTQVAEALLGDRPTAIDPRAIAP